MQFTLSQDFKASYAATVYGCQNLNFQKHLTLSRETNPWMAYCDL